MSKLTKKQQEFIRVYRAALGILSLALQESNTSREDYEEWLDDAHFEEEVKKIGEVSLDFVENQLIKEIKNGNLSAITYYLKTKGKDRGYN